MRHVDSKEEAMTAEQLKATVIEQFEAAGLVGYLDLESSEFRELPRFFEVSHLEMELAVTEQSFLPGVRRLAEQVKSELFLSRGIEVDVLIRARTLVS
jgi:hypothetical protein